MLIRDRHLSVGHALALTPGDVFRDGAGFFLGQAGHQGDQKLSLAVEGVDVLLFEIDLNAVILQFPNRGETVHGVAGEAAHALCDD